MALPKPEDWVQKVIDGPSQLGVVKSIAVDINSDGLMDVLSASIDDGNVRGYINQGNLHFNQEIIDTDAPGILQISLADVNSDGQVDLLGTSILTDDVFAYVANQGLFEKKVIANQIPLPVDAAAGDFNADGMEDVVSLSFGDNQVLLHLQSSPDEFVTSVLAENVLGPRKLEIVDLNADQLLDILVVSSEDNSLRAFINNGNVNTPNIFDELLIDNSLNAPRFLTSCEVSGDGFPEVLVADTGADRVLLFRGINGTSFEKTEIATMINGVGSLLCDDLDNDLTKELLAVAVASGEIYELAFRGDQQTLIANSRDGYLSLDTGDFDGDGIKEVLTQSFFEQRNLIYHPHFENAEVVVWEEFPEGASSVGSGDISGDGIEDMVLASFRDNKIQWYDGITAEKHLVADGIAGAADVEVVDLDQDGKTDVISVSSNDGVFYWHQNKGNGVFNTVVIFDEARFANSIAVGDINGDGQLDVVGTSGTDDSVRWFNRNGTDFDPNLIDQSNDGPNDVEIADLDEDGDLDLVVANYFSDDVSICTNHMNESFDCQVISQDKTRAHSVTVNDFDLDGDLDFYISASSDDQVWLFENDMDTGKFIESVVYNLNTPYEIDTNRKILAVVLPIENEIRLFDTLMAGNQPYLVIEQMIVATSVHFQKQSNYSMLLTSGQNSQLVKLSLKDLIFFNQFDTHK